MKNVIILFLASILSANLSLNAALNADSLAREGVKLVNAGKYREAIAIYDKILKSQPDNIAVIYEKGVAHYKSHNYDSVIALLEPIKDSPLAFPRIYQILGNSYDISRRPVRAEEIYKEGLRKFPNAGRLYVEIAVHFFDLNQDRKSLTYLERGVRNDPEYPDLYYLLSRYFYDIEEYSWSIVYGEIFMHLSSVVSRLNDISKIIYLSYAKGFFNPKDSAERIKFTRQRVIGKNLKARDDLPFAFAVELILKDASKNLLPRAQDSLTIKTLYKIRSKFLDLWYKEKWNSRYSNPLFDLLKTLKDKGYFEAYNYWLFNAALQKEAEKWLKNPKNKKKLNDFGNFMAKHELRLNKANYVSHRKY